MVIIKHAIFKPAGQKECQNALGYATLGMAVVLEQDYERPGFWLIKNEDDGLLGWVSDKHGVAKALNEGASVIEASVNLASGFTDAWDDEGAYIRVRIVTGPDDYDMLATQPSSPKQFPVPLVGESNYQAAILACTVGQSVQLLHEPDNPYDAAAIAVATLAGETLGYIERDSWVHRALLDERKSYAASIMRLASDGGFATGVVLMLTLVGEPLGQRVFKRAVR